MQVVAPLDWLSDLNHIILQNLVPFGVRLIGAIALWIAGGWVIRFAQALMRKTLHARGLDATIIEYVESGLSILLRVLLVIATLGVFGVETASFAAIIAAAGVAIGVAWSGLLANFAAGIFLILLRPIRVGDFITVAGITGTVREIGMFASVLDQQDNVRTTIGNNKIFADNIVNYSANSWRRVDLTMMVGHEVDLPPLIAQLQGRLAAIPNVMRDPAPQIAILEAGIGGAKLAVRPYCHNDHYWQVFFDTNRLILELSGQKVA